MIFTEEFKDWFIREYKRSPTLYKKWDMYAIKAFQAGKRAEQQRILEAIGPHTVITGEKVGLVYIDEKLPIPLGLCEPLKTNRI